MWTRRWAIQPPTHAHHTRAGVLTDLGRFEDAQKTFYQVLALAPDFQEARERREALLERINTANLDTDAVSGGYGDRARRPPSASEYRPPPADR